jgi:hypothetical protein
MKPWLLYIGITTLALTACGGGSGGSTSNTTPATTLQTVHGTLPIGLSQSASQSAHGRKPAYVSPGTTNARVYINGSTTAANSSTACTTTGTNGTGTGCTIAWSTQLAVPGSYNFVVEVDDGTNVLAEGEAHYAISTGNNTLTGLTLNGVAATASFTVDSCSGSGCSGTITLADADLDAITYGGTSTTIPDTGTDPTSGDVFDDGPVTLASDTPVTGTVSGGASAGAGQTETGSPAGTISTWSVAPAGGTLTIRGVTTGGTYGYEVSCAPTATGTFGISLGDGPSLTASPLGSLTYPPAVVESGKAQLFTCTGGTISSATGTLPVN